MFFKSALEAVSALLKDISWKFGLKLPGFLEAVGLKLHGILNQFLFKSALKILNALLKKNMGGNCARFLTILNEFGIAMARKFKKIEVSMQISR